MAKDFPRFETEVARAIERAFEELAYRLDNIVDNYEATPEDAKASAQGWDFSDYYEEWVGYH